MSDIKESIYNIYYNINDKKIIYNSLYGGLAIINEDFINILKKIKNKNTINLNTKEISLLELAKKHKYIIDDDIDELLDLRTKKYYNKFNEDTLSLTIAPTLDCNFRCIYCYETCKKGIIDSNIQNEIIDFIQMKIKNIKQLNISWYGGEPLIAKHIIYNMSEKIISICEENGVKYSSFMITNGSLITDEDIYCLKNSKIEKLQITLDGPVNIHNSRRISKNNTDNYSIIINNINKLLNENFKIYLRINIDKTNREYIEELFSTLSENLVRKNIKFSFGKVTAFTEVCKSIAGNCYDSEEFAHQYLKLYKYIIKYGFTESNPLKYPKPKYNYCGANNFNSFVIDPEGYVYKCWNDIGNYTQSICNIKDIKNGITSYKHGEWLFNEPLDDKECKKCKLLPLCMGGCPHKNYEYNGSRQCDGVKYNLESIIKHNYIEKR